MSLFDKLQIKPLAEWRPDPPPLICTFKVREGGCERPTEFAKQQSYIAELRLSSQFWANSAQLADGRRIAERVIAAHLYGDLLSRVAQLEDAVFNRRTERAFALCTEMRNLVTEGTPHGR